MTHLTDADIARAAAIRPIADIAATLDIPAEALIPYGHTKAKIDPVACPQARQSGKLILVTAINPTPAGEGKTTITIGLADSLNRVLRGTGNKAVVALREPSLGPVFGVKGGAAGGGYAQVIPMEDINLHFTGDMHAIGSASNLLAALIDNHIHHGNALNIDPKRITWRRALDMNDRQLRHLISGNGKPSDGTLRPDGFDITVASEVMAVFCLASDLADLKERLGNMLVAYSKSGEPVHARDLHAQGAMAALLKDAIKPNLAQTLEGTPAFIHGGPFANIAHGCNSVIATRLATQLADYTVTEAGFGADLGAEKFMNIKCRHSGLRPDCAVIVATVRALKYNGGVAKAELGAENVAAVEKGVVNLLKHIENIQQFGIPAIVAINRFASDSDAELDVIRQACARVGAAVALADVWGQGSAGGQELAEHVLALTAHDKADARLLYDNSLSLEEKIRTITTRIYGADGVDYSAEAAKQLRALETLGYGQLPVCMAKTQYSLSDNPALLGRPQGFRITVREVTVSAGAGFVVVLTGDILRMPGLPKSPAAERIDIDADGTIHGLF